MEEITQKTQWEILLVEYERTISNIAFYKTHLDASIKEMQDIKARLNDLKNGEKIAESKNIS